MKKSGSSGIEAGDLMPGMMFAFKVPQDVTSSGRVGYLMIVSVVANSPFDRLRITYLVNGACRRSPRVETYWYDRHDVLFPDASPFWVGTHLQWE